MKKKKRNTIKYSKLVILFSLFLFVIMILRLVQLGLSTNVDGVNLKKLASKRTTKKEILPAERGSIYSHDKDALAQNVASYKLIAYLSPKRTTDKKKPQHVVNKEETAKALSPILGMSEAKILKYLNKEGVYQTEFGSKGRGLNEITKNKIVDLNLPGLDFEESYKRYYPKGDFASYTIGYANTKVNDKDNTEDTTGEMGIEKYYDKILRGEQGYVTYQKDLKGYKIADTKEDRKEATQGKDIYLTINSNIQFFVEQAIKKADSTYGFEWFHITVMDAKTGAILATSTAPSFDPNKKDMKNYLDYLVASPYEPGSTMKTFTYMAAMENGVYNGAETYHSGVYKTKDGTEIGDWDRTGWGDLSFDKGYAMSSNVGVINLINRHMNSIMLRKYFRRLGFGRKTGITLPYEDAGSIDFKYETEIYNAGFGQGITTTPIQNVKALTPLTNDGMVLQPYIVDKIVDPDTKEVVLKNKRRKIERVASSATIGKILSLMNDCVNGIGNTGSGYRIDSGELIGKTGTAQIAKKHGGGYVEGKENVISSFAGIYPKSDPQIIIYASVKKPGGGSQTPISNAVKDIVNNVSKYYGHDKNLTNEEIKDYKLPSLVNKKIDVAKNILETNKANYQIIGNGNKVIKQYPKANKTITNKDTVYLITNDSHQKVPDVKGLSSKVAKNILELMGLKVKLNGVGYVTNQSINTNIEITKGMEITLSLKPKFSP